MQGRLDGSWSLETYHLFEKGVTLALHESAGNLSVSKDLMKITCKISSWSSLNRAGLSLSGLAAFPGFRFRRNFKMSFKEMSISGITGTAIWNCLNCRRVSGPFIKSILLAHLDKQTREKGILRLKKLIGTTISLCWSVRLCQLLFYHYALMV